MIWPAMPSLALGAGVKRKSRSPRLAVNWHNTRTETELRGVDAGVGGFPVDMGILPVCGYIQYHPCRAAVPAIEHLSAAVYLFRTRRPPAKELTCRKAFRSVACKSLANGRFEA